MFLTGICPTYRQPALLASLIVCWEAQDYPPENRRLVILDDAQTFDDGQQGETWELHSAPERFPSLPAKYNHLLTLMPPETDAVFVIETDDIYRPAYLSSHAAILAFCELSKPSRVYSDYPGKIIEENAVGRFHASLSFRRELIERIGGWPDTRRADFDQQLIQRLYQNACGIGDPLDFAPPQYVYSWRTGHAHCQSTMRSADDENWYQAAEQAYKPVPRVGRLVPQLDERTKQVLQELRFG